MSNLNNQALKKESKNFSVHPAIIYSIISKQASGIPKALLELAMNSVDAGATELKIKLTENEFEFTDNGKGFKDIEEVESFFGTFGTPHEDGDAFYGKYRLGRGQSMTYAKTQWYTKDICMNVDLNIDPHAMGQDAPLGYKITTGHDFHQGCKIVGQFYKEQNVGSVENLKVSNDQTPESMSEIIPAFVKMIRYLPIPVFINGVRVNKDIESVLYVENNDDALYALTQKFTPDNVPSTKVCVVNVYNKGVYAYQLRSMYFTGDVTTHTAIDLNMARNQAKTTCGVANAVIRKLSQLDQKVNLQNAKKNRKKSSVVDVEITAFVDDFWKGILGFKATTFESIVEAMNEKVFILANDKRVSMSNILSHIDSYYKHAVNACVEPKLYYYNDNLIDTFLDSYRELMSVKNGYLPLSIFPSDELIESLNFEIELPQKLFKHYLKDISGTQTPWIDNSIRDFKSAVKNSSFSFDTETTDVDTTYNKLMQYLTAVAQVAKSFTSTEYLHYELYSITRNYSAIMGLKSLSASNAPIIFANPIRSIKYVNVENLKTLSLIRATKLNPFEKAVLLAIESSVSSRSAIGVAKRFYEGFQNDGESIFSPVNVYSCTRKFQVLNNDDEPHVLAWTDGDSFVAFNEHYFRTCIKNNDYESLMNVAFHEVCHISDSKNANTHGDTFYYAHKVAFSSSFKDAMDSFYASVTNSFLRKMSFVLDTGVSVEQLSFILKKQINEYHSKAS